MHDSVDTQVLREKSGWISQIRQSLANGDYSKAKSLAQNALGQFPDDPDLLTLEEQAIRNRERSIQAHQLMEEGQQLCEEKNFEEGVHVLRESYTLDEHSSVIRKVLVENLLNHARSVAAKDANLTRTLIKEANDLDPENPLVKALNQRIEDYKRNLSTPPASAKPADLPKTAPPSSLPHSPDPTGSAEKRPEKVVASSVPENLAPQASVNVAEGSKSGGVPPVPARPAQQISSDALQNIPSVGRRKPQAPPVPASTHATPLDARPIKPETVAAVPPPPRPVASPKFPSMPAGVEPKPRPQTTPPAPIVDGSGGTKNAASPERKAAVPEPPPWERTSPEIFTAVEGDSGSEAPESLAPQIPGELPQPVPQQPALHARQAASWKMPDWQPILKSVSQILSQSLPKSFPKPLSKFVWLVAAIALLVCGVLLGKFMHSSPAVPVPVLVEIHTSPPGAEVRINGEDRDISAPLSLLPGKYHVEALLEGYETTTEDLSVASGFQSPVDLTLAPAGQHVRISTDLEAGSVQLDNDVPGQMQDGQFSFDSVKPGKHVLKITSARGQVAIPFEILAAGLPVLTEGISAKNFSILVVGSYQGRAQAYSNGGPAPLLVDGRRQGLVSQLGAPDMGSLPAGLHEFVIGMGKDQRSFPVDLDSSAGIFLSIVSDRNIGNLEVVSNESAFQVLVDGKPRKVISRGGHYYIYNLDAKPASIQIVKQGFQSDPAQRTVDIAKGQTVAASFRLTPVVVTATLRVTGMLRGTQVSVDGSPYEPQSDGSLTASLNPGEHVVEFSRQGYKSKSAKILLRAGQTAALNGSEAVVNEVVTGRLVILSRSPENAKVVLRRRDGTEIPITERDAEEPEGDYSLVATAAGYRELSRPVHIAEGAPASLDVALTRIPQTMHMEGWYDAAGWIPQDGWYTRRGGPWALYQFTGDGVFQFTAKHGGKQFPIFRGGRLEWAVHYLDSRNYDLYEIDKDKLYWKRVVDGKAGPEKQEPHGVLIKDDSYQLRIELSGGKVVQKIYDGQAWKLLPELGSASGPGKDGSFGFYLPGNDEIRINNFEFTPAD